MFLSRVTGPEIGVIADVGEVEAVAQFLSVMPHARLVGVFEMAFHPGRTDLRRRFPGRDSGDSGQ